jgi:hypothetical protein
MADNFNESPAQRIAKVGAILKEQVEVIYQEGVIPSHLWDVLLEEQILGKIAPNPAVARAVIQQIQKLQDDLLTGIIIASLENYKSKDKFYTSNTVKMWMSAL